MGKYRASLSLKIISLVAITLCLFACASQADPARVLNAEAYNSSVPLQIYLVRHAEKQLDVKDPPLTSEGQRRSKELMRFLTNVSVDGIYSTDYRRTLQTAAPSAEHFGLNVKPYNPRALEEFSAELKGSAGVYLVVGHSNTTPQLVELLGGDAVSEIDEATEYDRLYHVLINDDGSVQSKLLRYGKPYLPPQTYNEPL